LHSLNSFLQLFEDFLVVSLFPFSLDSWEPCDILRFNFGVDVKLDTSKIGRVFLFQIQNVVNVIPKVMFGDMFLESLRVLLHVCFVHTTNVAFSFFVFISELVLFLQSSEGVHHYTTHDVLEHHLHEHNVSNIKEESTSFKLVHTVINSTTGVQN